MNPANANKQMAKVTKKSYWEYMISKGKVTDFEHTELDKLEAYKAKCEARRNEKGN
jgi:hypothetical protein